MAQKITTQLPLANRVVKALSAGGFVAIIFAPIFLVFLVITTFMLLPLTGVILAFTTKLLGIPIEGAMVSIVLFWSVVVYMTTFGAVFVTQPSTTFTEKPSSHLNIVGAGISVLVFFAAVFVLFKSHFHEHALIDERGLAIEFVKNNEKVIRDAGGNIAEAYLVTIPSERHPQKYYDIGVRGQKRIYAIVSVSGRADQPVFSLDCTTSLYIGQRDPFKHPCKQTE